MMRYQKIGVLIRHSTSEEKASRLSPAQMQKLTKVSEIILAVLAGAGIVALTAISPNILGAVTKILQKKYPHREFSKREKDEKLAQAFYYLKRSGKIRMKFTKNDFKIFSTSLGRKRLKEIDFNNLEIKKPETWDGKWWLVAADIPTKKYRIGADLFRAKLRQMKFYPLQRTLWLHPYDPRREIEEVANHYGVANFVTVMEINRLDREDKEKMEKFFRREEVIQ